MYRVTLFPDQEYMYKVCIHQFPTGACKAAELFKRSPSYIRYEVQGKISGASVAQQELPTLVLRFPIILRT